MNANRKGKATPSSLVASAMSKYRKEQTEELFKVNRMKRLLLLESTSGKNSASKSENRGTMEPDTGAQISAFKIDLFYIAKFDLSQAIMRRDEAEIRVQLRKLNKLFHLNTNESGVEWNNFSDLSFQQSINYLLTPGNINQQDTLNSLSV